MSDGVSDESVLLSYEELETDSDSLEEGSVSDSDCDGIGGSFEQSQYFG